MAVTIQDDMWEAACSLPDDMSAKRIRGGQEAAYE